MGTMSNNQWNNGPAEGEWQPQSSASEWGSNPEAQRSAGEWSGQGGDGWGQQDTGQAGTSEPAADAAQGEQPASDWNQPQASANDWNQPQASASDWNQPQAQQGWDQQSPQQQGWDQSQAPQQQGWDQQQAPQQGWGQPGVPGQQWQQPQGGTGGGGAAGAGIGALFDFQFKKLAVPASAGLLYMIVVVALGVRHLIQIINLLASEYLTALDILSGIVQQLITFTVWVVLIRVFFEGVKALVASKDSDANPA